MPVNGDLPNWPIFVNTVGTYGVSSASWRWARLGSLSQRITYYVCGLAFVMRYADDYLLLACNRNGIRFTRPIMRFLVLCSLVGFPLKWAKTRGGLKSDYIGYSFCWDSLLGGLSDRRASWLVNWCRKTASAGMVEVRDGRAALGRMAFSTTLLRHILPYLGPIYSWLAVLKEGQACLCRLL